MREPIQTPPLALWPTMTTVQSWQYIDGQDPVDFTQTLDGAAYSAEMLLLRCNVVKHRFPLDLDAEGYMTVSIPPEVGEEMRSCKRIDAAYQINITSPIPELSEVLTGPVIVHEVAQ